MKKLLLGVLLLALWPASASAYTTLTFPAWPAHDYVRWVQDARVPTPGVALRIDESAVNRPASCGGVHCTMRGSYTIWMQKGVWKPQLGFLHELGHNFDYYALPEWGRQRFLALSGDPRPWISPPSSPHESFADAYALCAFGQLEPMWWRSGHLSQRGLRRVCSLIRSA